MSKYWLDPKISWKTFKLLQDKIVKDDLKPLHGDRALWQLLKERRINMFIDTKIKDDPMCITLKSIPKGSKIINSPKV